MNYVDKLNEIIKKKNSGEISSEEAEQMKYELVKNIDDSKAIDIDNSCGT